MQSGRKRLEIQSPCLEQLLVTFLQRLIISWVFLRRHGKSAAFVYGGDLPDNVVVESIKGDDKSANPGWLAQESVFGERILLKQAVFECADTILHLLIMTIEGSEVQIRRAPRFSIVSLVGHE